MAACGCMVQTVSKVKLLKPSFFGHLFKQSVRHAWRRLASRGKPPEEAAFLSERLLEIESAEVIPNKGVNIGFPAERKRLSRQALREWSKQRSAKEQLARLGTLSVPVEDIHQQFEEEGGLVAAKELAEHYGIFRDLFDGAHFVPNTCLSVQYDIDEELVAPVYRGNRLQPSQTSEMPCVQYSANPDSLWTLVLTNPDGHLQENSAEVLHWFIGNIPGSELGQGEIICDYFPPFPPKGTGFHRYIFILYKQEARLDYSQQQRSQNCTSLQERRFKTLDFYRKHQEQITPAGLTFFQAEWDESVTNTFRNILDMGEPSFEFVHPPVYHPKQVKYPGKQPFNLYMDRYRDLKDLREEVLREKLRMISPFSKHPESFAYPNVHKLPVTYPQWLREKIQTKRLRKKQWADLP